MKMYDLLEVIVIQNNNSTLVRDFTSDRKPLVREGGRIIWWGGLIF